MNTNLIKRVLSLVLCLVLLAGNMPVAVFATGLDKPAETNAGETIVRVDFGKITSDVELPDNGELHTAYAQQLLYGSSFSVLGTAAGERLTGDEKVLYDAIVPIVKQIANGQRSSTSITVGQNVEHEGTPYIAEVAATFTGQDISEESLSRVLDALLTDLPFEMYWFDKTEGMATYGLSGSTLLFFQIDFAVAQNYQAGSVLMTDTTKTGAAAAAVSNAAGIAAKYAGASDYNKLAGYRDEICALVTYNETAADANNFSENDDPWQLIYVFDGDDTTNVVCEGYSKAFMYLCDLTTFTGDVTCCTVTGLMGTGAHMWNIVTLEGSNYLVDVTNSDTGSVGQNGGLFLAGTSGSIEEGYTFLGYRYTYDMEMKALWGTGADSILTLSATSYGQQAEPEEITGTCGENLTWELDEESGVLTISGTGAMFDYEAVWSDNPAPWHDYDVSSAVIEAGVTSIGAYAFDFRDCLESITIPGSVTSIGKYAFRRCGCLTSVEIPQGVVTIGEGAFEGCELTDVSIPSSVTEIGAWAFMTTSLTSVVIPEGVVTIGEGAFEECWALTSIHIPSTVTTLGYCPFVYCRAVTEFTVENGNPSYCAVDGVLMDNNKTTILQYPGNKPTTTYRVSDNVSKIEDRAFSDCVNLIELTIPDSVTSIGDAAFGCWSPSSIKEVHFEGNAPEFIDNPYVDYEETAGPVQFSGMTVTAYYPINNQTWTSAVMQNYGGTVTWVAEGDENVLTSGTCGENLTWSFDEETGVLTISGTGAMANYGYPGADNNDAPWLSYLETGIKEVVIEKGVTSIGDYAFFMSQKLESITIPAGVTAIKSDAFSGCSALTDVYYAGTPTSWYDIEIDETNEPLDNATIHHVYLCVEGHDFANGSCSNCGTPEKCGENLTWELIEDGIMTISGSGDMYNPASRADIPWFGIEDSIRCVYFDGNVTSIGNFAFDDCTNLETIPIPSGVTSIGDCAFRNCDSLTSIRIPKTVTTIGQEVFSKCDNLASATLGSITTLSAHTFDSCSALTSVTIPDTVTSIAIAAFNGCSSLTNIILPSNLTFIGTTAFAGCTNLTSITIPANVDTINSGPFYNSGLKEIIFLGNIPSTIRSDLFGGLTATAYYPAGNETWTADKLQQYGGNITWQPFSTTSGTCGENLTWELIDGVLTITGSGAITSAPWSSQMESIKTVIFEGSVTGICVNAFSGCTNLVDVYITDPNAWCKLVFDPNESSIMYYTQKLHILDAQGNEVTNLVLDSSVTAIPDFAFYGSDLVSVTIPDSVTRVGKCAFQDCTSLTSVTIPDSEISFDGCVFQGCTSLTSIEIPGSVSNISLQMFEGCTGLASVTLGEGVVGISSRAFFGCTSLTEITLPEGMIHISTRAFSGCTNLSSITIPDSLTGISSNAFSGCSALTDVFYGGTAEQWTALSEYTPAAEYIHYSCTDPENHWVEDTKEPTCTEAGYTREVCSCNYIRNQVDTPATGTHIYDQEIVDAKYLKSEATCTEAAVYYKSCACGLASETETFKYGELKKHECVQEVVDVKYLKSEATCTEAAAYYKSCACGHASETETFKSGNVLKHQYENGACVNCGNASIQITSQPQDVTADVGDTVSFTVTVSDGRAPYTYQWQVMSDIHSDWRNITAENVGTAGSGYNTPTYTITVSDIDFNYHGRFRCVITDAEGNQIVSDEVCPVAETTSTGGTCGENLTWELIDGVLTITGSGDMFGYSPNNRAPWYEYRQSITAVEIPSTLTAIGKNAFQDCTALATVTLPDGITSIPERTFAGCSSLKTVNIPDSVTCIDFWAFDKCSSLTSLKLPAGATDIKLGAFAGCSSLTSINIPHGVRTIGASTFLDCSSLTGIKLPNSLTSIGEFAFGRCSGLAEIVLPESLTELGVTVFAGCRNLKKITFTGNAPTFGTDVFGDVNATVHYPVYKSGWTDDVMQNYGGKLTWEAIGGVKITKQPVSVTVADGEKVNVSFTAAGDGLTYTWYYKNKGASSFSKTSSFTGNTYSITMDEARDGREVYCVVTDKYGNSVQTNTVTLTMGTVGTCGDDLTWTLVNGLLTISGTGAIGDYTLEETAPWYTYREAITSVEINEGVTGIGFGAFLNCTNLKTVKLPASVTKIYAAFISCSSLENILVSENNTNYCTDASGVLYTKNMGTLVVAPATLSGNYEIPDTVNIIYVYAFDSCKKLTGVKLPAKTTTLNNNLFRNCTALQSIEIPSSVTLISNSAFVGCSNLTKVYFPRSLATIENGAFNGCSALKNVYYAGTKSAWTNVSIGTYNDPLINATMHFAYLCTSGHDYVDDICSRCGGENPNISGICGENLTWTLNTKTGVLTISGSGAMGDFGYGNAPWYKYSDDITAIVVEPGVTTLGDGAFYSLENAASLSLPDGLIGIGDYAICACGKLEEIRIPESVTTIGYHGISNCHSLKSIYVPAAVTHMDDSNFVVCGALPAIVVDSNNPNYTSVDGLLYNKGVTELIRCPGGFSGDVEIPASVTKIRKDAFWGGKVRSVVFPKAVTQVGESAFSNCQNLRKVVFHGDNIIFDDTVFWTCQQMETVIFTGTAPKFGADCFLNDHDTTIYYPSGDPTWTSFLMQDYGGTITWVPSAELKITKQPVSVTVANGKTAKVSFTAAGDGLTYTWYFKNAGEESFRKTASFTGNSYSTTMDAARDGRQAYCVVTDQYGNSVQTDIVTLSMQATVKITQQPESVTVKTGEVATVSFTATGDGLTYTWYFKNPGASSFSKTSSFTGNTYSITMSSARSGRQVYCVVKDQYGNSVKTNTVTITMKAEAKITQQPKSVTVANGKTAKVSFTATGDGLTYTWYFKNKGASSFSKTSSFTGNTYSTTMDAARDGRQVYCVVTDKYGNSVTTDTVTLSMQATVKITQQPEPVTVKNGEVATVSFTATGDGLVYTWYFKNPDASSFSKTTSFTGNTYSITMSSARSGRQVYCVVKDQYGNSVKTNTVTVTMKAEAKITQQPKSVTVANGKTAKVSFTATGDGLTYTWYFKNKGASSFSKTSSFTGNTYSTTMDAARDGREVYCVVTDKYGNTVQTDTVTLSMTKENTVKITAQPKSVEVAKGSVAKVSFTATGDGLTYTWYFKNKGASSFSKTSSFTGNTYSATMDAARDGRQVYCVVTDQYGNTAQTDTVTLSMISANTAKITAQPKSVEVAKGSVAKVSFTATGDGLTYTWYFKNKGASSFSKTSSFTGNTYSATMDAARDGRQVYCVVTDKYGNTARTDTVTLSMTKESTVKITAQPKSVAVEKGTVAKVSFTASGEGLTYTWYFKNKGASSFSKTSSFTGNTYSATMDEARDGRQIYCVVADKYGNTARTDTVTLSMK